MLIIIPPMQFAAINISYVIPDELHLFMRIFDVLIRNLIDDVIDKDDRVKVRKQQGGYLDSLVITIRIVV